MLLGNVLQVNYIVFLEHTKLEIPLQKILHEFFFGPPPQFLTCYDTIFQM